MNRFPPESTATAYGLHKLAEVAGPPSPRVEHPDPSPATVVMTPVTASTRLTRWFDNSAMKRFPAPSYARPRGSFNNTASTALTPMTSNAVDVRSPAATVTSNSDAPLVVVLYGASNTLPA